MIKIITIAQSEVIILKIKKVILILLFLLMLSSCTFHDNTEHINQNSIGANMCTTIIECFNNDDADTLKEMFCNEIKQTHNLDQEIINAFNFVDGTITSHSRFTISSGKSVEEGIVVDNHIYSVIDNVTTDKKGEYMIVFDCNLIYLQNENLVGVLYLKVINNTTGEKIQIGEYV